MDKQANQARVELLRDLIVSLKHGVVIGKAIGSDELKRPLAELEGERDALKAELSADAHAKAEQDRVVLLATKTEAKRASVRELVAANDEQKIRAARLAVRAELEELKAEYEALSGALQYLEAGARVQTLYDGLSPEEREAFDRLKSA
jgi:hypothetical protein